MFDSHIELTNPGIEFQPANEIELLSTDINVKSLMICASWCNQNPQCRTFDYQSSSPLRCRLFEGGSSTGTQVNSSSPTSRLGAISYYPELYSAYNQSCNRCQQSRYLLCVNDRCQCPPNTFWNSSMCSNQHYSGLTCQADDWCRQDLNLTCFLPTNTCVGEAAATSTGTTELAATTTNILAAATSTGTTELAATTTNILAAATSTGGTGVAAPATN
ncbi:unnamed protein product, partial [Didymodactylos carnosus]